MSAELEPGEKESEHRRMQNEQEQQEFNALFDPNVQLRPQCLCSPVECPHTGENYEKFGPLSEPEAVKCALVQNGYILLHEDPLNKAEVYEVWKPGPSIAERKMYQFRGGESLFYSEVRRIVREEIEAMAPHADGRKPMARWECLPDHYFQEGTGWSIQMQKVIQHCSNASMMLPSESYAPSVSSRDVSTEFERIFSKAVPLDRWIRYHVHVKYPETGFPNECQDKIIAHAVVMKLPEEVHGLQIPVATADKWSESLQRTLLAMEMRKVIPRMCRFGLVSGNDLGYLLNLPWPACVVGFVGLSQSTTRKRAIDKPRMTIHGVAIYDGDDKLTKWIPLYLWSTSPCTAKFV